MKITEKIKNDLYWEHEIHNFAQFISECSSCYKESEDVKLEEVQEDYEEKPSEPEGHEYNVGPNDV